jgi:DNA-directed RNA polymerase subunit RPC12/RpoP
MKPRTRIQNEVVRLSSRLPELTDKQKAYAYKHCFSHIARMMSKGIVTCTDCGHSWKCENIPFSDHEECTCPYCGSKLEIMKTRQRVFKNTEYFSVITTCKGYQVIRFFIVRANRKVGYPAEYEINEIVQQWIAPNGRGEIIARLRCMSSMYYDLWNEHSCMELRSNSNHFAYDITPQCTYPHIRIIKKIRRNGFKGKFYDISPNAFFKAILYDNKMETLLKVGQIEMFRHFIRSKAGTNEYWAALKICIRNGYEITNASEWCDYIDMLKYLGKDIRNAKYVCPMDLKKAHDKAVQKKIKKEVEEEIDSPDFLLKELRYKESKSKFLGLAFSDGLIHIKLIGSVKDMILEGKVMHHSVGHYYTREDSLVFSATIDGKRIETVEVSISQMKVVQCSGVCNKITQYHNRIIQLVENNLSLIQSRVSA